MTRVERLSEKIAVSINSAATDASSVAVLKYSLEIIINYLIYFSIISLVSLTTGDFKYAVIAGIGFPLLRYFSGGIHFDSSNVCNIVSSLFVLFSVYISVYSPIGFWYTGIVINTIALIIVVFTAPANVERSNLKENEEPIIKLICALIISSNYLFQLDVLAVAFLIQALTTLPGLQKLLDRVPAIVKRGRGVKSQ